MKNRCLLLAIFTLILFSFPNPLQAGNFGISPSALKIEAEYNETITSNVILIRANPKEDEYILVSTDNDPTGAIQLTSGERFLLPRGEFEMQYNFLIDTSKLEDLEQFNANIRFATEEPVNYGTGNNVILANSMDININFKSKSTTLSNVDQEIPLETKANPVSNSTDTNPIPYLLVLTLVTISATTWLLKGTSNKTKNKWLIASIGATTLLTSTWIYTSEHSPINKLRNVDTFNIAILSNGAYFVITSETENDLFLHPTANVSQSLEGSWRYIATKENRVYAIPLDTQAHETYQNKFLLFHEAGVKLFNTDALDGAAQSIQENIIGTYALFTGTHESGKGNFWCISEVWETIDIKCINLNDYIPNSIQSAWFSDEKHNIAYISTNEAVYAFDVWSKEVVELEETTENNFTFVQSPKPLTLEERRSKIGIISLDEKWFFAPFHAQYYPLDESLWIEHTPNEHNANISLIDTRTQKRFFITELQPEDQFCYLEKESWCTSP